MIDFKTVSNGLSFKNTAANIFLTISIILSRKLLPLFSAVAVPPPKFLSASSNSSCLFCLSSSCSSSKFAAISFSFLSCKICLFNKLKIRAMIVERPSPFLIGLFSPSDTFETKGSFLIGMRDVSGDGVLFFTPAK